MPTAINLVPAAVQMRVAIGASVGLRLHATHADGTAFDLTPYTVEAPFRPGVDGNPPPLAGWAVTTEGGTDVLLTLLGADTSALAPTNKSVSWHWDVWLTNTVAPERLLFAHGDLGLLTA